MKLQGTTKTCGNSRQRRPINRGPSQERWRLKVDGGNTLPLQHRHLNHHHCLDLSRRGCITSYLSLYHQHDKDNINNKPVEHLMVGCICDGVLVSQNVCSQATLHWRSFYSRSTSSHWLPSFHSASAQSNTTEKVSKNHTRSMDQHKWEPHHTTEHKT